jgi:molecular chaperone IbpA
MRNLNLNDYFDEMFRDLNRFAVGFEPTLRNLDYARQNSSSNTFPPYDLEKIGDNQYRLSMAVAGYASEDIVITQQGDMLTIEGSARASDGHFLYKGIAGRSFKRSFMLDSWVSITSTALNNGILELVFTQEIPEAMKPRRIPIGNTVPNMIEAETTPSK